MAQKSLNDGIVCFACFVRPTVQRQLLDWLAPRVPMDIEAAFRSKASSRDPRLDVARGLALVVIFAAHMPQNPLWHLMPGRFGFSDSAEIFVFCSGMAAALAFGRIYDVQGWLLGTARVLFRIWQIYWAHIGVFLAVVAMNVKFDLWSGTGTLFVESMRLKPFLDSYTGEALVGLLTLGYVPNYFDILPLYMIVLLLVPLVMALAQLRQGLWLVLVLVLGLWSVAEAGFLELAATPWNDRRWFFNPFSWQLLFFIGFALARGWLPAPPRDRRLMLAAIAFLIASLPIAWEPLASRIGYSPAFLHHLAQLTDKTHLGALRVAHFAALGYVAFVLAGESGRNLIGSVSRGLQVLGRETLSVFVAGLMLSMLGGYILSLTSIAGWAVLLVNVGGVAILYAVAVTAGWFKSAPWKATPRTTVGEGRVADAMMPMPAAVAIPVTVACSDAEPGQQAGPLV